MMYLKRFECNQEIIKVNSQEVLLTGLSPLFLKKKMNLHKHFKYIAKTLYSFRRGRGSKSRK